MNGIDRADFREVLLIMVNQSFFGRVINSYLLASERGDRLSFRIAALFAAVLLCICLCGCSAPVENLLVPPRLSEEQNEIYQELINSVGQDVKLKYPKSGQYRSAFVLYDIDSEPESEAMVFYESRNVQSGESSLRLKIMDKTNGKWEAVFDLACAGSEVESISFAKLGTSNLVNIIICYTILGASEKTFSVIHYVDRTPTVLYSASYACLEVTDLNNDGQNELVTVTTDKVNQTSYAEMFSDGEDGFIKLSDCQLYGGAADYIRVTDGMISPGTKALFLDFSKGGGQSGTDVVYCFGNRLLCPNSVGDNPATGIISRLVNDYMAEMYSYDIDGDGYVEVPSTVPLPGYETLTKPEQLCAVQWYSVENNNFTQKYYSYFSSKFRFALLFPNRWVGVVSAKLNFPENEIIFTDANGERELMRIRAVNKEDKAAMDAAKGLKRLGESEDTYYCCIETNDYRSGKLALTDSELVNSFIII